VSRFTGTREQKLLQELLKELRIQAGFTQISLAQALNRPQSFVSKYESGEKRLDFLELRQLCLVLGISVSKFVKLLDDRLHES
jgi:transcriptional regulator with XRE-family HTH domain